MVEGTHFVHKVVVIVLAVVCTAVCAWFSITRGTQARVQLPDFSAAITHKHHEP